MIKRPMKGVAVEDLTLIRFPCLGFPKIDGFRCPITPDGALTSRLSRFPNEYLHRTLQNVLPSGVILDGEVVVGKKRGKGVLQRTSSGVTGRAGEPDFKVWVWDQPSLPKKFGHRTRDALATVIKLNHPRIRYLTPTLLLNFKDLETYLAWCLDQGYEGIITRDPNGMWKDGKSTLREQGMLKVKPFEDAEGRVIGWYEEKENTNEATRDATGKQKRSSAKAGKIAKGTLGGLILEDCKTQVEVRVGGGFTDQQRRHIWEHREKGLKDRLVKYKKQMVGEKDKPRHPNFVDFLDFRPEWDFAD